MTVQPDPNTPNLVWAVQRELDGLRNGTEHQIQELHSKVDKTVTHAEYDSDKRFTDLKFSTLTEKMDDIDTALSAEIKSRQDSQKEEFKERRMQFRWIISAILIPITLTVMDLLLHKK